MSEAKGAQHRRNPETPLFYLWHLEQVGLLDTGKKDPAPAEWRSPRRARVAIIDSGCTRKHPNLPASAIECQLDVAVSADGAVFHADDLAPTKKAWATLEKRLRSILALMQDGPAKQRLVERAAAMSGRAPLVIEAADPAMRFSGHGTACAGLVAGRTLMSSASTSEDVKTAPGALLPYFGVNPHATIIPIATPYSPEIAPIVTALLHAIACEADVILLPRTVNELRPPRSHNGVGHDKRRTRFDSDATLTADKEDFEALLGAIAEDRPVVLASGNEGRAAPAYPASLVGSGVKGAEHLIVVGAMNQLGLRSAYSNGDYATGVTIYGPSDDEEAVNSRVVRADVVRERDADIVASLPKVVGKPADGYSPFGVLALDVPGRYGAAGREEAEPRLTRRRLYGVFGGTSAASAIVAGIVSLMQADGGGRLTGKEAKARLVAARPQQEPVLTAPTRAPGAGDPPLDRTTFFDVSRVLAPST